MLSEKGISDLAFCPALRDEPSGVAKRILQDRRNTALQDACSLIQYPDHKNNYLISRDMENVRQILTRKEETPPFWVNFSGGTGLFSVKISQMTAKLSGGDPYLVEILRESQYEPKSQEQREAERQIRSWIWYWVKQCISDIEICVISKIPSETIKTREVDEDQLAEAFSWAENLWEIEVLSESIQPNYHNCGICKWWGCPRRSDPDTVLIGTMDYTSCI